MGWFWGSSSSGDGNKSQDPLRGLDPSLRDFLAKESPVKYSSSDPPPAPEPIPAPTSSPSRKTAAPDHSSGEDTEPKVPPQSLFKDGRYAHLWKGYQPQDEIEAAGKSDQEKIDDVLEGYKYRKAEIGRAALENCALEQWQVNECFRNGGWASRLTMCRTENRELERCYLMQSKFLKALGYLSTFDRPPELDERIQMHADTLYHRMLEQEKAIESAKAERRPVPTFPPLLSAKSKHPLPPLDDGGVNASDLKPKIQKELKKRLEGLSEGEREVEERAIKAEIQAGVEVAKQLGSIYEKQDEERKLRKEQGKETIGDKITSILSEWELTFIIKFKPHPAVQPHGTSYLFGTGEKKDQLDATMEGDLLFRFWDPDVVAVVSTDGTYHMRNIGRAVIANNEYMEERLLRPTGVGTHPQTGLNFDKGVDLYIDVRTLQLMTR